ncbi:MAG: guanylate kinase [Proteobacteria bacterium]|nr:guanylate kinase [Pseudomonadota bacterium]MBU1742149.1 guanylate kinase [Pseudomonadota bacterium]
MTDQAPNPPPGDLFVVSAPSGAGKSTLLRRLRDELPDLVVSVSHTTRPRRPDETHARDYFFVGRDDFQAMVDRDDFLEHALVFNQDHYGTARLPVVEALGRGRDVYLDIDPAGMRQVKAAWPGAVTIMLLPPSFEELERRLRGRGTESEEDVRRRLDTARAEIDAAPEYDYLVVNDDLARAVEAVGAIIRARRSRRERVWPTIQLILT